MARSKGSFSFVSVKLADLNAVFKSDANVLVSRKFVELHKIGGQIVKMSNDTLIASGNPVEIKEAVEEKVAVTEVT